MYIVDNFVANLYAFEL